MKENAAEGRPRIAATSRVVFTITGRVAPRGGARLPERSEAQVGGVPLGDRTRPVIRAERGTR